MLACGEIEAVVMVPPLMCDSSVSSCFHGCLPFLHWHFPPQSPPSPPPIRLTAVNSSPHPGIALQSLNSSSQLLRLPVDHRCCPEYVWLWRRLSDSILFFLGCHRSAVSLSALNVSPLTQLPWCGVQTPASVSPPAEGRSKPTNTSVFPPSSFILPSFAWFYIFFSTGQVLLYPLSWCSARTSVSEGVFLMYLWREMYPTSTYSSTI